jgi:lysophospholipase L1-like esterase
VRETLAENLVDTTTVEGTALASAFAVSGSSQFSTILQRAQTDATLVVLGDSTGNETTEWVYLFAQWITTTFPDYDVSYRVWNDATQAYDAASTIGSGPLTVNLYNGSMPGAGYNYPMLAPGTRFAAMVPTTPDAVIVSYGYNSTSATYRAQMLELAQWVRGIHPTAELIVTSQPPVATVHADFATNFSRRMDIRAIAASERWGLIDATQAFLDYGNFDALISGDNLHPNTAGSQVWFEEVVRYFTRVPRVAPAIAPATVDRIFVNASQFHLYAGTPAISFISGIIMPKWDFDAAVDEMIATIVDIPPSWAGVNVSILWSATGGSTNSVVWQVDSYAVSDSMPIQSGKPAAAATAGTPVTSAVVSSPANVLRVTPVYAAERFSGGRPLAFRVRRLATNGSDTYTSDAYMYGLLITRSS